MDGFKKNFSSSAQIMPSAIPRLSSPDLQLRTSYSKDPGEINENDQNFHQMGSKMQNPKNSTSKNFMSPTISTASKVALPKKKILVERNEAAGSTVADTHLHQTPNARPTSTVTGFNSSQNKTSPSKVSESNQDEENTFVPDPSSQPYDPLTNYLSPRPKFLRYKPNRRLEFFHRRENELAKGEDGLRVNRCALLEPRNPIEEEPPSDAYGSSSSPEGSAKQEDVSSLPIDNLSPRPSEIEEGNGSEEDDGKDTEEVEEEERNWTVNKVLKSLLLLGILFLSTIYISSMNSPTPPPYVQALQDLKDGYQKIQGHIFQYTVVNFKAFLDQNQGENQGRTDPNERISVGRTQEEQMVSYEMKETAKITDKRVDVLVLQGIETAEVSNNDVEKTGEIFQMDEMLKEQELTKGHSESFPVSTTEIEVNLDEDPIERMDAASLYEAEQAKDEATTEATERVMDEGTLKEEMVQHEMGEVANISDGMSEMLELLDRETADITQVSNNQFMLDGIASEDATSDIPYNSGTEISLDKEEHIKGMRSESTAEVVGVFVIVVSMVLVFLRLKCRRTSAKDSSLIVQSSSELEVVKNRSSELPKTEEQIEKGDSYLNLSSSVHSEEKASKDLYRSGVPKVELLGEYVVGELSRSSIKSCSLKSKMIEAEESKCSVSQEKKSKKNSFSPYHVYQSPSEFSAIESPSYRSFTAQEKIVRKEEGGKEEKEQMGTTPVRRSSRIRNRAVTSP